MPIQWTWRSWQDCQALCSVYFWQTNLELFGAFRGLYEFLCGKMYEFHL